MLKILYILLFICFLPLNIFSQTGWIQQTSGTTKNFYNVFFVDQNTGYITGDTIMKTTNSGTNWTMVTGMGSYGLYFLNANTGFAGVLMSVSNHGIGKTTNGGLNWSITNVQPGGVNSISFINDLTGWAAVGVQFSGNIYKTTDGGSTWNSVYSGFGQNFVQFLDENSGYSISYYGSPKKSTDGGINWFYTTPATGNIGYAINRDTLFSAGLGRLISRSTNGGSNWDTTYSSVNNMIWSFYFPNQNTGYAVGGNLNQSVILYSSNSGTNWSVQQSPAQSELWAVKFINPMTGWAVGDNGTILKTTTGGIVGLQSESGEIPSKFQLHQNYPNPFNPETKIKFEIPAEVKRETSNVKLIVYDVLGCEVETLFNQFNKAGSYEISWNSSSYPSGVYFAKLSAGDNEQTIKMILLK